MRARAWLSELWASVVCWASLPGSIPHAHQFYMMTNPKKSKQDRGSLNVTRPGVLPFLMGKQTQSEEVTYGMSHPL